MKKIRAFLLFSLYTTVLTAQGDSLRSSKPSRWELGMNTYALTVRGGDFYSQYKRVWNHYVFNGLYAKFYHKQSVWRASVSYMNKITVDYYRWPQRYARYRPASARALQLAAGWQRMLGGKRLEPYLTCELALDRTHEAWEGFGAWPLEYYSSYLAYTRYEFRSTAYSLAPGLGLRLSLGRYLVLSAEAGLQLFYAIETSSYPTDKHEMLGIQGKPLTLLLGFKF